jgi:hypothetical protein
MSLLNINTDALKGLIKLTQRKESLLAEIEKIESQLASLLTGKSARGAATGKRRGRPAKKKAGRPAKKKAGRPAKAAKTAAKGKRASRGGLKNKILSALKTAGDAGVKVTDLAKKIGVKNTNVHVWFSTTGKKHPDIKKVGKGHFKLVDKKA